MINNKLPVALSEQTSIAKALILCINQYRGLPVNKVEFQSLNSTKTCISLYCGDGSYKTRTYMSGSYIAVFNFKLLYSVKSTNTNNRVENQELLENIGKWLENLDVNEIDLTENRKVEKIEISGYPTIVGEDKNGNELYKINMSLKYYVKKGV